MSIDQTISYLSSPHNVAYYNRGLKVVEVVKVDEATIQMVAKVKRGRKVVFTLKHDGGNYFLVTCDKYNQHNAGAVHWGMVNRVERVRVEPTGEIYQDCKFPYGFGDETFFNPATWL